MLDADADNAYMFDVVDTSECVYVRVVLLGPTMTPFAPFDVPRTS